MKNKFYFVVGLMALGMVGIQAVNPSQAQAVIILGAITQQWELVEDASSCNYAYDIACIILSPLIALDKNVLNVTATRGSLAASGVYTPAQIDEILADQENILKEMNRRHEELMVTSNDTKTKVDQELRSIDPKVSEAYLDYFTTSAELK